MRNTAFLIGAAEKYRKTGKPLDKNEEFCYNIRTMSSDMIGERYHESFE